MITSYHIRFFLFIFGCIGSRLIFTTISSFSYGWILSLLGFLALIPVIGWFYIIFIGKRDTGIEVLGDKIWWKALRPVHMILWGIFSYMAISGNIKAWRVLFADTILGLSSFILYHHSNGNFNKLQQ